MGHRGGQSARERQLLSRIRKLLGSRGLLRANLVRMRRVCGRSNCRCVREGRRHAGWTVQRSEAGRHRTVYVPARHAETAAEWIGRYKEIRELLEAVSQIYWEKIRKGLD
jgi:hypothetical protein